MEERITVRVSNLHKKYTSREGLVQAVRGVSFDVKDGEFYTLLGPSGCGKTTTLRCVAGLERIDQGEIAIGDSVVAGPRKFVPPYQRPIGMVFQSYAIWPHMTVAQNIAFPLKNLEKKYSNQEMNRMIQEVLALVQLDGLGGRPAPNLSGGQQQRLALARALVYNPMVLLLDEPLSNLDAKLREEMRLELKSLSRRLGITTIYVTHDQLEALVLSDKIALMRDGLFIEEGEPYELYMYPRDPFTASFFGVNNILEGKIVQVDRANEMAQVDLGFERPIASPVRGFPIEVDQKVQLALRPENINLEALSAATSRVQTNGKINAFEGEVREAVFLGDFIDYKIAVKGKLFRVRAHPDMRFGQGSRVILTFASKHACLLEQARIRT
ncbi:MAG: ABC transporter ATP-binding protein [Thermodesulfobacteriota bacterium]